MAASVLVRARIYPRRKNAKINAASQVAEKLEPLRVPDPSVLRVGLLHLHLPLLLLVLLLVQFEQHHRTAAQRFRGSVLSLSRSDLPLRVRFPLRRAAIRCRFSAG